MLLTASFPLVDVRSFLDEDTGRLPSCRWSSDAAGAAIDFLPFLGAIERVRGEAGREPRAGEGRACIASRFLRFASSAEHDWLNDVRCVQRELRATNDACMHLDVGLATHRDGKRRLRLQGEEILEQWSRAKVHLRVGERSKQARLRDVGTWLARAYALSTTAGPRRGSGEHSWIIPGNPVFFIEWSEAERNLCGALLDGPFEDVPSWEGVRIRAIDWPALGVTARVYLIDGSGSSTRGVRMELLNLHAEREGLRAILDGIGAGWIAPKVPVARQTGTPWSALFFHQRDALRALHRARSRMPRVVFEPAQPPPQRETRGWANYSHTLDTQLRALDAPFNVRHGCVDFYADEYNEERLRPERGASASRGLSFSLPEAGPLEPPTTDEAPPVGANDSVPLRATFAPIGSEAVEPAQEIAFLLDLRITPDAITAVAGGTFETRVAFPQNQDEVELAVFVSSKDFRKVGEPWNRTFRITRGGPIPAQALFRGCAIGDKRFYEITIYFQVSGSPEGEISLRIPRRGLGAEIERGLPSSLSLRTDRSGARVQLALTNNGSNFYSIAWRDNVTKEQDSFQLDSNTDVFFTNLLNLWSAKQQPTYATLLDFSNTLEPELPKNLIDFLQAPNRVGVPMQVLSAAPVFPIELLVVGEQPLGVDRPILRWIPGAGTPESNEITVQEMLCIRPVYTNYPLPEAEEEVTKLGQLGIPMRIAQTRDSLASELAQEGKVQLVHFAGHAQDSPAKLLLGDAASESFEPTGFMHQPLMKTGPFLFLNGCKAAKAAPGQPAARSNMMKVLLRANFSGVVAPVVEVYSPAAKQAALTFYDALLQGKTVGEATQAIRSLAQRDEANAGTYLSYLSYASTGLKIHFQKR